MNSGAKNHAHGRKERLDCAGGLNVLYGEPGRDIVDPALVIAGR
ncbi:MAG TPA: hypothetical protein VEF89_19710 [Solirubrobacteraceae bacterium]|nr:hypothetical protein [Solirubrobacteraceae bacterium]